MTTGVAAWIAAVILGAGLLIGGSAFAGPVLWKLGAENARSETEASVASLLRLVGVLMLIFAAILALFWLA